MSAMPPGILLEIEFPGPPRDSSVRMRVRMRRTSSRSVSRCTWWRSTSLAHRLEARTQRRIAGHCARVQQRLVLPGPGFAAAGIRRRRRCW